MRILGMCPSFDPHKEHGGSHSAIPQGMKIPTLIMLYKVLEEFIEVLEQIAKGIGDLF